MIETWIKHAFPGFPTQGMQCRTQFGDKTWEKFKMSAIMCDGLGGVGVKMYV